MSYPRVLLVHMTRVYQHDGVNLLIRSLFGEWPRENLAQIFTGRVSGNGDFCGQYFEIGHQERRLGRLFYALKPKAMSAVVGSSTAQKVGKPASWQKWKANLVSNFIASGYWDLLFSIYASNPLIEFVRNFKPDIIYTQGYSLSFTALALDLARRFKIPICYFPMDDWHSSLFAGSLVHRRVEALATELAQSAALRFALGPKMTETLTARYGIPFESLYHADDPKRFYSSERVKKSSEDTLVIGYVGSLYLGRSATFQDLFEACVLLKRPFRIDIYCENIPPETPAKLLHSPQVNFLALPDHNSLPKTLANCDVLFIPESFETKYKPAIELSLSTKSHLYMFSQRPILIYAPPWSGTVDYAKRSGWGIVVDREGSDALAEGLRVATSDQADPIVAQAYHVAMLNHNLDAMRATIRQRICEAVGNTAL